MRIMITCLTVCLLINGAIVNAQSDSLQRQINEQVWKPFIKEYNDLDAEKYMAVHSKDITRVVQDGNRIFGYDLYYQNFKNNSEQTKQFSKKIMENG